MSTQTELQRQNERLELLLNLSNKITSNLDLRDVISAVSGNLRSVMRGDLAAVSLPDEGSGKFRIYVLDFPESKGIVKEGHLITPSDTVGRAVETLQPVIFSTNCPEHFPPEVYAELSLVEDSKSMCITPLVSHARVLGRQAAVDRLAEYVLILLLRDAVGRELVQSGTLRGLSNERMSRALVAMHEHPEQPWDLDRLAAVAGMSRARFAAHFRDVVGTTPITYLTNWRMAIVQTRLRRGEPLKSIAAEVGCESPPQPVWQLSPMASYPVRQDSARVTANCHKYFAYSWSNCELPGVRFRMAGTEMAEQLPELLPRFITAREWGEDQSARWLAIVSRRWRANRWNLRRDSDCARIRSRPGATHSSH